MRRKTLLLGQSNGQLHRSRLRPRRNQRLCPPTIKPVHPIQIRLQIVLAEQIPLPQRRPTLDPLTNSLRRTHPIRHLRTAPLDPDLRNATVVHQNLQIRAPASIIRRGIRLKIDVIGIHHRKNPINPSSIQIGNHLPRHRNQSSRRHLTNHSIAIQTNRNPVPNRPRLPNSPLIHQQNTQLPKLLHPRQSRIQCPSVLRIPILKSQPTHSKGRLNGLSTSQQQPHQNTPQDRPPSNPPNLFCNAQCHLLVR